MTANPFAALLDGVPRIQAFGGNVLSEDYVLAALAAAYPADLAEAGKVLEGVTPGKWSVPGQPDKICAEGYTKNGFARTIATVATPSWMTSEEWSANASFIAWCREGVPALLARIAAQEAQIKGLEEKNNGLSDLFLSATGSAKAARIALAAMTKERDELRDMLGRAQHVVPDLYTKWHEKAATVLKGVAHE